MNRTELEQRLRRDAGRVQAGCPESVRGSVLAHIRSEAEAPVHRRLPWLPMLAGACAVALVAILLWLPGSMSPQPAAPELASAPPEAEIAGPDRLLTGTEAVLVRERSRLEDDLRVLRSQVALSLGVRQSG